jgi:hypothetical protein
MKNKITTIFIVTTIVLLAGIAIFTAIRLYQLRQQPVAPNAPESQPAAATTCDLDVILTIDKSRSMSQYPSKETKKQLDYAKDAATAFVDTMSTLQTNNQVRIGLSTFGSLSGVPKHDLTMNQSLTSDFAAVKSAISSFPGNGKDEYRTCISCGIKKANEDIRQNGEVESQKVVILLSDGCSNVTWDGTEVPVSKAGDPNNAANQESISFANEGKALGYKYYVVGFGGAEGSSECSHLDETLTGIASTPVSQYYQDNPNPADWAATFSGLATKICESQPPEVTVNSCQQVTVTLTQETATPSPIPTATATVTSTTTPNGCGGTCGSNSNCETGLYCYNGYCRNPSCPAETDCTCESQTPQPTTVATLSPTNIPTQAPQASLPNAGVTTPTLLGIGIGAVFLIISIALAI